MSEIIKLLYKMSTNLFKRVFNLIFILFLVSSASASNNGQITNDTIFQLGNDANITVLAPQNFSDSIDPGISIVENPPNTLQFVINDSNIQFNSTTDKTLSNITRNSDVVNWTYSGTGTLNVNATVQYQSANYTLYRDGTALYSNISSNNFTLIYSLSQAGNYSIQRISGVPALISPTNQSTQTLSLLPYTQTFTWSEEGTTQYDIQVAKDAAFSIIVSSITVTSNTTSIQMIEAAQYFWRVRTRSGTTTGTWSEVFNFELTQSSLPSSDGTTGIQGIVYEVLSTGNLVLSSARVEISNSTWTGSTTTDSSGYYRFTGLRNVSLYSLEATKSGYGDSNAELVTTANGTWVIKNIYMQSCVSNYYGANCGTLQFVKFVVQNIWGTEYSGVTTNVYRGSGTTAIYTGSTGSDGSITFLLLKDQEYRLTFANTSFGINEEMTLYPQDPEYHIIVPYTTEYWYDNNQSYSEIGTVNITVNTTVNATGWGFINVVYTDPLSQTSGLVVDINQTNSSDPTNQTIVQSYSGGSSASYSVSHTVNTPSSKSYIVNVRATHTTFGSISRSFGVKFVGMPTTGLNFIPDWFKAFMAVGLMFFVAAFASVTSHNQIAGLVCVLGWVFYGFGWFASLGGQYSLGVPAGLTLATIVVVMANMKERAENEGVG